MTTRDELRAAGDALRARLGTRAGDEATAPGYQRMVSEALYGGIWSRPGLPLADRYICVLAALCLKQNLPQVRRHVAGALEAGLAPRAILEIFVQCGLYGGFPTAENAMTEAHAVFAERGLAVPAEAEGRESLGDFVEMGTEKMAELHGDRGGEGYARPDNPVTGQLYALAIQYGYGWLWHRAGLDRRQRMICAVAAFTALGLEGQLRKFGQSALNVGLSKQEVIEVIIQTAPYGGFPRSLNALALLGDVLR